MSCKVGFQKRQTNHLKIGVYVMGEKKSTLSKEVEDTMACSAFAEAGEPCPIGANEKEAGEKKPSETIQETMACSAFAEAGEPCPIGTGEKQEDEKKPSQSVQDTMACAAFAEAGEPCPIDPEEKKD